MNERWNRRPPVPGHRDGESGDHRQERINGTKMSPLVKVCLGGAVSLLLLFITGLSGYAWTRVSGDATFAKDGVIQHEVRIEHLEDAHVEILDGQKTIIGLLFIQPKDRKRSDLGKQD